MIIFIILIHWCIKRLENSARILVTSSQIPRWWFQTFFFLFQTHYIKTHKMANPRSWKARSRSSWTFFLLINDFRATNNRFKYQFIFGLVSSIYQMWSIKHHKTENNAHHTVQKHGYILKLLILSRINKSELTITYKEVELQRLNFWTFCLKLNKSLITQISSLNSSKVFYTVWFRLSQETFLLWKIQPILDF